MEAITTALLAINTKHKMLQNDQLHSISKLTNPFFPTLKSKQQFM
jgi:hypothetical protein